MDATAILLIVALVLFLLSAFGVSTRVNLQSLGLASLTLAVILGGVALI